MARNMFKPKYQPRGMYLAAPTPGEFLDYVKPWIPVVVVGGVLLVGAVMLFPQLKTWFQQHQQPATSITVAAPSGISVGQAHRKAY